MLVGDVCSGAVPAVGSPGRVGGPAVLSGQCFSEWHTGATGQQPPLPPPPLRVTEHEALLINPCQLISAFLPGGEVTSECLSAPACPHAPELRLNVSRAGAGATWCPVALQAPGWLL